MPRAALMLRHTEGYRRDLFAAGLTALGYDVVDRPIHPITRDDVLVLWNRMPTSEAHAQMYEHAGARVVIAENGYIAPPGVKTFALALGHHNGAGRWPFPEHGFAARWRVLGIELQPWRQGRDVVVLCQRGIGEPRVAQPAGWANAIARRIAAFTRRKVRVRPHPGSRPVRWSLEHDLQDAWCAVTWGSGAAVKALAMGVPVVHELKAWIGAPAAALGLDRVEAPYLGSRLPMFQRLAWAQWTGAEIESGEAFTWLLQRS